MEYTKCHRVHLKETPDLNEKWLQQQIASDVEILGLGEDLVVREVERRQPGAGRLDVLLYAPDTNTRFEVEIQLGKTGCTSLTLRPQAHPAHGS